MDASKVTEYTAEYVETLEARVKAAEAKAEQVLQAAEVKLKEGEAAFERQLVQAELKAHAIKAGLVDLDALVMADLSAVKLKVEGGLEGVEGVFERLREAKPYLFGQASTSSTQVAPAPNAAAVRNAKDMNAQEYGAALAKLVKG
jgi:hypothetical protein